jgi:Cys-tRNA(Pro)/Cys-tRNA(Cys) deacylase
MTATTPASHALDRLGIPYRIFEHAQPPASLEDAAAQRGQAPEQVIRSIVFRVSEGEYVMVLMSGPSQISWKSVRAALGVSRMTMATEAEVLQVTGFVRGAVTPLGLPAPMRLFADEGVFVNEEVSLGSGVRGIAIIIHSADLRRAIPSVEIGKFC